MTSTDLTAEYVLIRPDNSLTTVRYLPIPDDIPAGQLAGYINDQIAPHAEHHIGWQYRILTTADSSRNADRRVAEVSAAWQEVAR